MTNDYGTLQAGTIAVTGGVLDGTGTGTVIGTLAAEGGAVIAGSDTSHPGTLAVQGTYLQTGGGVLDEDITGINAGQASAIAATGSVTLQGGTLDIITSGSFAFAAGQSFTVMSFGSGDLTGTFAALQYGSLTGDANHVDLGGGLTLVASYNNAQGNITLQAVTGYQPPAVGTLSSSSTIAFGNVHVGAATSQAVSVTNAASGNADALDASIGTVTPGVVASGSFVGLAAGATDTADIKVGLDTSTGGAKSGTASLNLVSVAPNGATASAGTQTVQISGAVYREAAASIAPVSLVLHVGDTGTVTLAVANSAAADGFSENLIATLGALPAGFTATGSGTTGDIVAGGTNSTALGLRFSAATPGVVSGTATVDLVSDGGTGAGAIDGLGQTTLSAAAVPLSVAVDNYATAAFEQVAGPGTLAGSAGAPTLDLGAIQVGSGPLTVDLGVLNSAAGPADLLSGSLVASGSSAFAAGGLAAFANLAAGQADTAPTLTLDTTNAGIFSEQITLAATGANASGYSAALAGQTLTVVGTVEPVPAPTITAPGKLAAFATMATVLGSVSVADSNAGASPLTVTISDTTGLLSAAAAGAGQVSGQGSTTLTLAGSLADINTMLASVTFTGAAAGTDSITLKVQDERRAVATQTIAASVATLPQLPPVLIAPPSESLIAGTPTALNGLSVSAPSAAAAGQTITLTLTAAPGTTLTETGTSGAVITGQGTGTLTLTGTQAQINADLQDPILDFLSLSTVLPLAYDVLPLVKAGITIGNHGTIEGSFPGESAFFALGVASVVYELGTVVAAIPGNGPPPSYAAFERQL